MENQRINKYFKIYSPDLQGIKKNISNITHTFLPTGIYMYKTLIIMSVFTAIFSRKKTDEELLVILGNPSHSLYDKTLEEFYRLKKKILIRYIEKHIYCDCGNKHQAAEDIFHDTIIVFFEKVMAGEIDLSKGSIESLLYRIAHNKALAFCDKLNTVPLTDRNTDKAYEQSIRKLDIESLLAIAQKENLITQLQADVYILHEIAKKKHEEIAHLLGITVYMSRQHKTTVKLVLMFMYVRDNVELSNMEFEVWSRMNTGGQSIERVARDLGKTTAEIEQLLAAANEKIKAFLSEELWD